MAVAGPRLAFVSACVTADPDLRPARFAMPTTRLISRLAGLAFVAIAAVIVFSTLCPIELRPKTGHVLLERFAAYLLLGATAAAARPRAPVRDLLTVAGLAAALELAQRFIPGRDGHLLDACEKIAGGAAGVLLVLGARGLLALAARRADDARADGAPELDAVREPAAGG